MFEIEKLLAPRLTTTKYESNLTRLKRKIPGCKLNSNVFYVLILLFNLHNERHTLVKLYILLLIFNT